MLLRYDDQLAIYGEKSSILIDHDEYTVLYGSKNQSIEAMWRAVSPYFTEDISIHVHDLDVGEQISGEDLFLHKITDHFVYMKVADVKIFFIGKLEEEEIVEIKQQRISFESDIWVLKSNYFPDFIDPSSVGIISLVHPRVSNKVKRDAKKMESPLLYYKNTGGFVLRKAAGRWELATRK